MQVYSTLNQSKLILTPLDSKKISLYVCGITPYDTTHLGHAYLYMFFDVLVRYANYSGFEVNYTQNVTDIDDDLLKRAKRDNIGWKSLGEIWTEKFVKDLRSLNILLPTNYVKATDFIPDIVEMVKILEMNGFTYNVDGTLFFNTAKFPSYGQLSKLKIDEMMLLSSERGADPYDKRKESPLDFILWQKSLPDEPYWNSPWGHGRPGWHIECSAMAIETLGKRIDIHGGGYDLIYPHHESEIAQSESVTGKVPFAQIWMHVGMLSYQGDKMSKSLGNLILISDLLKNYSPQSIRWLLLSHHYREEWEYFDKDIAWAQAEVNKITRYIDKTQDHKKDTKIINEFKNYMDDDFNTPEVLRLLIRETKLKSSPATLKSILQILGFSI